MLKLVFQTLKVIIFSVIYIIEKKKNSVFSCFTQVLISDTIHKVQIFANFYNKILCAGRSKAPLTRNELVYVSAIFGKEILKKNLLIKH